MGWSGALAAALLVSCPFDAQAHHPDFSLLVGQIRAEQVDLLLELDATTVGDALRLDRDGNNVVDAQELLEGRAVVLAAVAEGLTLTNDGQPCAIREVERYDPPAGDGKRLRILQVMGCPGAPGLMVLTHRLLMTEAGGHQHIARVQVGQDIHEHTFARGAETLTIDASSLAPQAAAPPPAPEPEPDPAPSTPWVPWLAAGLGGALLAALVFWRKRQVAHGDAP